MPEEVAVIVLGERGHLPQLTLLACTVHEDRIEAQGYILHRAVPRTRLLPRMTRTGATGPWLVARGALLARVPRLLPPQGQTGHVSLHVPLTVPLARRGR